METPTQSASPPKFKPRGRKQRSCQHREPFASDGEAVRAVLSADAFREVEELRRQYPVGIEHDIFFWQAARLQMVRRALQHPNGALRLMRAKIGAVGAMLVLTPSEIDALLAQMNFPSFVAGALANQCILEFQRDSRLDGLWAEPTLRANPPLRVEFEHAVVLGTINDAGDIAKHKSWGKLIALQPLAVDDRLYPRNITYMLKATSKLRMRWEFRDNFRQLLGSKRSLVTEALRSTKATFLKSLSGDDAQALHLRLDLEPDEFWRLARHGDRLGPDAIHAFLDRLEEKTRAYRLPFPPPQEALIQIQPAPR